MAGYKKHNVTKTQYYGSDVDSTGKAIAPPIAQNGKPESGINPGEIAINNASTDPCAFILDTEGNVVKIGGGGNLDLDLLDKRYLLKQTFDRAFTLHDKADGSLESIEALADFWTKFGVTSLGVGSSPGGGSGGASTFGELLNVGEWADKAYDYDIIAYKPANDTFWREKKLSDLVGLDETALAKYLTDNAYATQSWVTAQITGSSYTLPTASTTVLGGVKIGDNINITNGVISTHSPYELTKQKILDVLRDENGLIYLDASIAVSGGLTALKVGEGVNLPSIYDGLPIDGVTIYWENGILKAQGGGGLDETELANYLTKHNYYHAGNSNNYNTDWTTNILYARTIKVSETSDKYSEVIIRYSFDGVAKTATGYEPNKGSYLYNYASNKYLAIKDNGTPHYSGNVLYHAGNANRSDVDWTTNRLTTSGITLGDFSNSSSSEQWIRVFTSHSANNGSSINSALLMIGRNWSHASEESYTFMVTVGYDGRASINQLSSSTATQFFDKIRLLWKNGNIWYIDIHYTGSNSNDVFVSGSGCGNFSCSLNPTIPEGYTAKEFKVWQNSVTCSNALVVDSGVDTKLIFNNTDGEKYSTISFRENNAQYAYINVDGRDNGTFTFANLPIKVDSLYFSSGISYIAKEGSQYIGMATNGGNARGQFYRSGTYAGETLGGIGCYTENGNLGYFYIGWTSSPYNVNTNFHVNSERIRWKGQDILTSGNYQNYATSKVGDSNFWLYPYGGNEINFGGANNSSTIYFGYRAMDSKPIPSQFMFGGSIGQSNLIAKGYIARGTSSYAFGDVSIAHSFSTTPKTQLFHAQWLEGVDSGSWKRCVILLVPVIPTTNTSADNALQGTFFLYKTGGCITDRIEIYINSCWNEVHYHITESGMNTGATLNRCTYGGVDYYCLNLPYHANPYTKGYFTGWCYSNLNGGTGTVPLPKFIAYKDDNTGTIINSEINNSLTGTLTTSVVTSASRYGTKFNGEINVTGDIKTSTWMYAARHTSADNNSPMYLGNSNNASWIYSSDICSSTGVSPDANWSVRVSGSARFKDITFSGSLGYIRNNNSNQVFACNNDNYIWVGGSQIQKVYIQTSGGNAQEITGLDTTFNGNIIANGGVTALGNSSSDISLKDVQSYHVDSLSLIRKIGYTVAWKWNDYAKTINENFDDKIHYGHIANMFEKDHELNGFILKGLYPGTNLLGLNYDELGKLNTGAIYQLDEKQRKANMITSLILEIMSNYNLNNTDRDKLSKAINLMKEVMI